MNDGNLAFKGLAWGGAAIALAVAVLPSASGLSFDALRIRSETYTPTKGSGRKKTTLTSPTPTPTPTPSPTPTPTTSAGGYPELTSIPSEFSIAPALVPSWGSGAVPPNMGSDPVGAFRFICGAGPLRYDDPILFPGQPGRSHLHQFYGNTGANAYSTYESLRTSGDGTCGTDGAGHTLNRSAYWIPAILDGRGSAVQPDYIVIYYKRLPDSDPNCHPETNPQAQGKCIALPNGLRFIAGSDMKGGYRQKNVRPATQYATPYRYACYTPDGGHVAGTNPWALSLDELGTCPVGNSVGVTVQMPDCWDGKNLDSPDHGSHVDYQYNTGLGYFRCDDAHPYLIPGFMISVNYSVRPGDEVALWKLSSDAMDPTKPRGWSLHADWFGAWDPQMMATWTANCINKHLSCTGGDLGNGTQMKGAAAPSYGWTNPQHLVPIPSGGMAM